jgi:hypothetical protein
MTIDDKGGNPPQPQPPAKKRKFEVLVDNLGPKRYQQGQVVSDPELEKIADTPRGRTLMREVK